MPGHDIIVIGASAGGVEALTRLARQLPADFCATLLVVLHFPANSTSVLPQILNRSGPLPAHHPRQGEKIQPGQIYVAPPDHHLLVRQDRLCLSRGPRENGHRPAIDSLFRSASYAFQQRVIGIILSGMLDDGVAGLATIKAHGGLTIVQDPQEALFNSMPRHAIAAVEVDYILKLHEIAPVLVQLLNSSALPLTPSASMHLPIASEDDMTNPFETESNPDPETNHGTESDIVLQDKHVREQGRFPGSPSPLTCPDCGGVLWELHNGNVIRFRCHVGHAYSLDSLMAEQAEDVERALWSAVRVLEEKAALSRRLAIHAKQQNRPISEARFLEQAEESRRNAAVVRQLITQQTLAKSSLNEENEVLQKDHSFEPKST